MRATRLTVVPSSSRMVISAPGFLLRPAGSMRVGSTVPRNGARMATISMTSRMVPPMMTLGFLMAVSQRLLRLVDAAAIEAESTTSSVMVLNTGSSGRTGCS